jgi:hypothetical protein
MSTSIFSHSKVCGDDWVVCVSAPEFVLSQKNRLVTHILNFM